MAKQFGTTAEVRNYGSVMVSSPAVAIYAAASGRFESPRRRHTLRFLANVGLPGTSGFVGELLVIIGVFQESAVFAGIAALTLILGAAYALRMYKRAIYGKFVNDAVATLKDLEPQEKISLGLIAFFVLLLGVWPFPLLEVMHPAVDLLIEQTSIIK